jgi:hypothetical protein
MCVDSLQKCLAVILRGGGFKSKSFENGYKNQYVNSSSSSTLQWLVIKKVKVKCTLVQALRLCTGRTAHRGSTGIDLPFLDHGTRRG